MAINKVKEINAYIRLHKHDVRAIQGNAGHAGGPGIVNDTTEASGGGVHVQKKKAYHIPVTLRFISPCRFEIIQPITMTNQKQSCLLLTRHKNQLWMGGVALLKIVSVPLTVTRDTRDTELNRILYFTFVR